MPATRLQTGFHRTGLVLAGIIAVPTLGILGYAVLAGAPLNDVVPGSGFALAFAAMLYWACRSVAWIAEGFVGAQAVQRGAAPQTAGRDWRRAVAIVLEGLLLLIVLATAIYYVVVALDEGQTFNMRLLGGWLAAMLIGLTFVAPIRNRIERIGTPAASDFASFLYGSVILLMILTAGGMMMGMRKDGPSADFILTLVLLCGMFFWPEARHRILTGTWRPA